MVDLEDRHAHMLEREGLTPASLLTIAEAQAGMTKSIPTRWHAHGLFEHAAELLGERGFIDVARAPHQRRLYLRSPDLRSPDGAMLVGSPLLELTRGASATIVAMHVGPSDGAPREPTERDVPQLAPRGEQMCAGSLRIAEGPSHYEIAYDEHGHVSGGSHSGGDLFTWSRSRTSSPFLVDTLSRPPSVRPLSLFMLPELRAEGISPSALAPLITQSDVAARLPLRVHLPVPVPETIVGVVHIGLIALRAALFDGRIPHEATWGAADGIEGTVLVHGSDTATWREAFERGCFVKKPKAPQAAAETPLEPPVLEPPLLEPQSERQSEDGKTKTFGTGMLHISVPGVPLAFPWPRMVPHNVPAVWVPLPPVPDVPPALRRAGYHRTVRCVGEHGAIGHVFVRDEERGFTAVGEHVADLVAAMPDGALEAGLDACDREDDEVFALIGRPGDERMTHHRNEYAVFEDERRLPCAPRRSSGQRSAKLGTPQLGDSAPWRVIRERQHG